MALALTPQVAQDAFAHHTNKRKRRKPFKVADRFKPQRVRFRGYKPGTIVVDPRNHYLYLVETRFTARRYGVGVGRAGLAFKGSAKIGRKAEWPGWTPTANMIRREPEFYGPFAGGVPGGGVTVGEGDPTTGVGILRRALEAPMRKIDWL